MIAIKEGPLLQSDPSWRLKAWAAWGGKMLVKLNRELAQLVERHPYKVDVAGSNPVLPTK